MATLDDRTDGENIATFYGTACENGITSNEANWLFEHMDAKQRATTAAIAKSLLASMPSYIESYQMYHSATMYPSEVLKFAPVVTREFVMELAAWS